MSKQPTQHVIRYTDCTGHSGTFYAVLNDDRTAFRIVLDGWQQFLPGETLRAGVLRYMAGVHRRTWPDRPQYWLTEPKPEARSPIRFWIYWRDGVVKITVPFGESVTIGYGGPTDEGWLRYTETFTHDPDDDTITREVVSDGVDCDGRMTHFSESVWKRGGTMAPLYEFADDGEMIEIAGFLQPDWELAGRCQRDYAAEAAGY